MTTLVEILQDEGGRELDLRLVAGAKGLTREISNARVQKPGLALAGHVQSVRPGHLQVVGKTEMNYLDSLDDEARLGAIRGLCASPLACIVVTQGQDAPEAMLNSAGNCEVAIFETSLPTERFINSIHALFDQHLSPTTTLHAVAMDVFGVGILFTGHSGIGKSECALDLIMRGHRLVADDVVVVKQVGQRLVASGSNVTRHHMEVRGLGIINVQDLFGAAAVREEKRLELVVEMEDWSPEREYDRLGIDDCFFQIMTAKVPRITLPIRPGRNIASIVEVAARNHLLKLQGFHPARKFQESLERRLAANAMPTGVMDAE